MKKRKAMKKTCSLCKSETNTYEIRYGLMWCLCRAMLGKVPYIQKMHG